MRMERIMALHWDGAGGGEQGHFYDSTQICYCLGMESRRIAVVNSSGK